MGSDSPERARKHSSHRRSRSRSRPREHHHHHHHRHHHHHSRRRSPSGSRSRHHHKRSRRDDDEDPDRERRHKSRRESHKEEEVTPPDIAVTDASAAALETVPEPAVKRDAWMTEPAADFIDYTQRGVRKSVPQPVAKPDYRPIIHKNELNQQLKEGKSLDEYAADSNVGEAGYTFGDSGSKWRMTKLKRICEAAAEQGKAVEQLAMEKYGDLRFFDEAREEEMELERREMYGAGRKDAKDKPTGELYADRVRKLQAEQRRREDIESKEQEKLVETVPNPVTTTVLDQTALNKMQAALMKAQLRGDPKAKTLEREYNAALQASQQANSKGSGVVVLNAMHSRELAGLEGRMGREVLQGKKGRVVENEDMSIEDMLREEKRTRGQGAGKMMAERISKDGKFDDNLDYLDENAAKLASRVQKKEIDIKNMAIHEFKKMQRVLDNCPLCQQDDTPPLAPVVSLATRVFLTLPTEPEISPGGAVIVPIQHRTNMVECDDDEWEEVRNFMKSLTRMYNAQGRDVIFYENAASPQRRRHAAIVAVPLPLELAETAPAYFKEAILSSDTEWSQHKPIIDTLSKARKEGLGKRAFRRSLVKEMPYFHVWFELDGGMGHVIEDENRWPKGDLFARELLGGMLDVEMDVIKRQGRWKGGKDRRVDTFRKGWGEWDWTKVLVDA